MGYWRYTTSQHPSKESIFECEAYQLPQQVHRHRRWHRDRQPRWGRPLGRAGAQARVDASAVGGDGAESAPAVGPRFAEIWSRATRRWLACCIRSRMLSLPAPTGVVPGAGATGRENPGPWLTGAGKVPKV